MKATLKKKVVETVEGVTLDLTLAEAFIIYKVFGNFTSAETHDHYFWKLFDGFSKIFQETNQDGIEFKNCILKNLFTNGQWEEEAKDHLK